MEQSLPKNFLIHVGAKVPGHCNFIVTVCQYHTLLTSDACCFGKRWLSAVVYYYWYSGCVSLTLTVYIAAKYGIVQPLVNVSCMRIKRLYNLIHWKHKCAVPCVVQTALKSVLKQRLSRLFFGLQMAALSGYPAQRPAKFLTFLTPRAVPLGIK